MEIKIKTLTPLWIGDVNRQCTKIKETGIIGSLRWWYEALVRGLGGYACDPTSNERCKLDQKKFEKVINEGKSVQEALDEQICPACQLFGCTGWKKKIGFKIMDVKGAFLDGFEGAFTLLLDEIKELREEEKWLLEKMFKIIGDKGSIGGRTTRKPHYNPRRLVAGKDYGLIKVLSIDIKSKAKMEDVETWLKNSAQKLNRKNNEEWPSLRYFFFVKGNYLNRIQINELMEMVPYLKGEKRASSETGRSKRIFSFKANGGRIWGYVKNEDMLKETIKFLQDKFGITHIKTFEEVIKHE